MMASSGTPCVVYPVGHELAGQCLAEMDGAQVYAADAGSSPDAYDAVIPPDVSPDTHPLCLVQRVAAEPGKDALYRNWCHPEAPPAPLPGGSSNVLLAARRLLEVTEDTCPRGQRVTFDVVSGRLRCAGMVQDPCVSVLAPLVGDEGQVSGYACRPAAPQPGRFLPDPCPPGTWLLPARGGMPEGTYECTNPCPQGQLPRADGSGAFVCMAPSGPAEG